MSRIWCGLALVGWGATWHVHAAPNGSAPVGHADAERRATPVASYAGGEVTVGEVEDAIGTVAPQTLADQSRMHMVQHAYEQTLRNELLLGEATRREYAKKPLVHARIAQLGIDMMLSTLIGEPLKTFSPSDEELQQFFKTRQADIGAPELRRVLQLVVATEAQARALLPSFQTAQGAALKDLIKQNSVDIPSRDDDGYSRYFDRAGLLDDRSASVDPALANAAFALPSIGAISDVVALSAGPEKKFALLKLLALRPAYVPTFQQATAVMKKLMSDERREQGRTGLEQAAQEHFPPTYHYELLNSLPTELEAPASAAK